MAGTRALFASIGASAALVAAAALSLLAVSAVFAFGGWSDSRSSPVTRPAFVFAGSPLPPAGAQATGAQAVGASIVVAAPVRRAKRRAEGRRSRAGGDAATRDLRSSVADGASATPRYDPPTAPVTGPPAPAAAPKPTTGDHVRKVGDTVSSTLQGTGSALADVTQPLAPPVSAAVQQVLNLVAAIVRRAAGGVGGALDGLLAPR